MITDVDVKKLEKTFATKEELEKLDARTATGFLDVQNQLNEVKSRLGSIETHMESMEHTMLTIQDNLVGEIHKLHIENKVTSTYKPRIEDHEQRITKVESVVFSN